MRITVTMLRKAGACNGQVEKFAELWPRGCTVTLGVAMKAAEAGLDLDWAASNLLRAPARKAYDEAIAPASKAYDEAIATARKAYDAAVAEALKVFDAAMAEPHNAYDAGMAEALVAACRLHDEGE